MSEVDIAGELPNGDDSAFVDEHQIQNGSETSPETSTVAVSLPNHNLSPGHVFVATSQGLISAQQFQEAASGGIKTTHIVIHDQTLEQLAAEAGALKSPTTPLPPPTPATPLSKEKGFRYQWDDSVHQEVLPVRCKHTNGELHKSRFGSGGRGKCIKNTGDNEWYTPNEFEALSGRASSKDWKRSIRYGGRTLQCLIEDNILQPHATSCTCASCCDDEAVTGPVRLFVPYKRRKKDLEGEPMLPPNKKPRIPSMSVKSPGPQQMAMTVPKLEIDREQTQVMVPVATGQGMLPNNATVQNVTLQQSAEGKGEMVHIVATDAQGNIVTGDAVVMTPISLAQAQNGSKNGVPLSAMEVMEQKNWWQLEEMANNLLQQAQQLKIMIDQVRQQSMVAKEAALQQQRAQMEKEKQEAVNATRIEASVNLSRVVMEERAQRDRAVQQAVAQAKMEHVTVISDDKVAYNVSWPVTSSGSNHISMVLPSEEDDDDKDGKDRL
ncbi:hypothetical protein EGW08_015494 [Elysia chlorotica]|uniref:SAND domain-containing protein n=1 Tax=Elysia chlorotica TaxID=188477 RepID=A0A3S0ZW66_ELYCH|nr:hypothetical protein EGW08_015494 [Elysia chlorotica]